MWFSPITGLKSYHKICLYYTVQPGDWSAAKNWLENACQTVGHSNLCFFLLLSCHYVFRRVLNIVYILVSTYQLVLSVCRPKSVINQVSLRKLFSLCGNLQHLKKHIKSNFFKLMFSVMSNPYKSRVSQLNFKLPNHKPKHYI